MAFKLCSSRINLYRISYVLNSVLPYDKRVKEDHDFGREVMQSSKRCQAAIPYQIYHFLQRLMEGYILGQRC